MKSIACVCNFFPLQNGKKKTDEYSNCDNNNTIGFQNSMLFMPNVFDDEKNAHKLCAFKNRAEKYTFCVSRIRRREREKMMATAIFAISSQ